MASVTLWMSWSRFATFHNRTFDLAFYARMSWGLAHGNVWNPIVNGNMLGLHLSWIMIPCAMLGSLMGHVRALLVIQSLSLIPCAIFAHRISTRRLPGVWVWFGAPMFLLHPNLTTVFGDEFHPGNLALVFFFALIDAIDRKHHAHAIAAALLAVACREDFVLVVLGALWIIRDRWPSRSQLKLGVALLAYLLLFVFLLRPWLGPKVGSVELHFGNMSLLTPHELAKRIAEHTLVLFLPFACLASPRWILPCLPIFGMNVLSNFMGTRDLDSHYLTPVLPFLFVGALEAIQSFGHALKSTSVLMLLACLSYSHVSYGSMPWAKGYKALLYETHPHGHAYHKALSFIFSDDAAKKNNRQKRSIQAPDFLLAHLAERPFIHRMPPPEMKSDWVMLHAPHRLLLAQKEELLRVDEEPLLRNFLSRNDHTLALQAADVFVFRKQPLLGPVLTPPHPDYALIPAQFEPRGIQPEEREVDALLLSIATSAPALLTRCLSVETATLLQHELKLKLKHHATCPSDLALRIGSTMKPKRVDLLSDTHTLTETEKQDIVKHGLRVGAIRQSGAPALPYDPITLAIPLLTTEPHE